MHIDLGADRILQRAMMAHLRVNIKMDTTKISLSSTFSIGKKYIPFKKYGNQSMWCFIWGQSQELWGVHCRPGRGEYVFTDSCPPLC